MPVINVQALEAERQASLKQDKLVEQEQTRRQKAKFKIPKTMAGSHKISKQSYKPVMPEIPIVEAAPIDPVTKTNISIGVRSVALTGLSMPIKKERRTLLRERLERNQSITGYIDKTVAGTVLNWFGAVGNEVSFLMHYGVEYFRAYQGDQRFDEQAVFTRPTAALPPQEELPTKLPEVVITHPDNVDPELAMSAEMMKTMYS